MIAEITAIIRYPQKGSLGEAQDEASLTVGRGMEGDWHPGGGSRELCLLSEQTREWIDAQTVAGLCFRRFKENIRVSGGFLDEISSGCRFHAGEAILCVSEKGKACFEECDLFSRGIHCRLSESAVFAAIERGGVIRVGDSVHHAPHRARRSDRHEFN